MLGFKFIKPDPTEYTLQYSGGKLVREGVGLSFYYFAPTTTLVSIPVGSADIPFIFKEVTADYQEVTVQGELIYRIKEPKRTAEMLDYTLDPEGQYYSEDPDKLPQRLIGQAQVLMKGELQRMPLREALASADTLAVKLGTALRASAALLSLGVEILGASLMAIKPTPETSRALEAEVREDLLRRADEAIYTRRNAAIEQERAIKENELSTEVAVENKKRQVREAQMEAEIAVENKKRQVREAQMDAEIAVENKKRKVRETQVEADRAVQERKILMRTEEMAGSVKLEEQRRALVGLAAENARTEADTRAYALQVLVGAVARTDPKVLAALATAGMEPDKLLAMAFKELAESATKIGELNISPDLLREIARPAKT